MGVMYAIYAFIIAFVDISAGLKLVKREGWDQLLGLSALTVGVVAFIAGAASLLGFYVDPLWILLPLVIAGFVIVVDSWKNVRDRGIFGFLIAIYNTFAWVIDLLQLLALIERRRE